MWKHMSAHGYMWKVHLALHNFRGGDGVPTEFSVSMDSSLDQHAMENK